MRDVGREARVDLLGLVEARVAEAQLDVVVLRRRSRRARRRAASCAVSQRLGDHRGDDLAAVGDVRRLEEHQLAVGDLGQPRRVLVRDDGEDAGHGERRAASMPRDLARAATVEAMASRVGDALDRLLVGVLRLAHDLRAALDAAERRADGRGERVGRRLTRTARSSVWIEDVARRAAPCRRCRAAARPGRARRRPRRRSSARSPAAPRSAASAAVARHGTWATPPSAIRHSSIDAVAHVERARRRR